MTDFKPTTEQAAILDRASTTDDNLMLVARAGCGKSATLKMLDQAISVVPHLYLVFNKANAVDAEKGGEFRSTTNIRTFNSLGHRIWAAQCSKKLTLSAKKTNEIFKVIADTAPRHERTELWSCYDAVMEGVNIGRAIGYIPHGHAKADRAIASPDQLWAMLDEKPSSYVRGLIDQVLTTCITWAYNGVIDFNDQCYMPALFGGVYPRFPLVLVDEYQDLSPVQHAMIAKLCKHSRQIGVGDDAQAIYGFRGADNDGMAKAIAKFSMETLPLSISFRCPSIIANNVKWRVPDFSALREGGSVHRAKAADIPEDLSTVICRNNAPLMHSAMQLLSQGRSVDVAGTDMSAKLIKYLSKLGDESMSRAQTLSAIENWQAIREANGSKIAADTANCMRVFAKQGRDLGQAISYAKSLFAQSGTVKFLSGHKSKGLEFDHVYHLDETLIHNDGQEPNLRYVIDTRSKDRLTYIYSEPQ